MASPTFNEAMDQLAKAIHLLETLREMAQVGASSWLTLEGQFIEALEADAPEIRDAVTSVVNLRSRIDAALRSGPAVIEPHLRTLAKVIDSPASTTAALMTDIRKHMLAAVPTQRIASRQFTRGVWVPNAAPPNIGDGVAHRLLFDEDGQKIESTHATTLTLEVAQDQNSGTQAGAEVLEIRGGDRPRDALELEALGKGSSLAPTRITARTADDSPLTNPSFADFSGTAAVPTAITGWTPVSNIANFEIDRTNFYRAAPSETTPGALKIKASDTLGQVLSIFGGAFNPDIPIFAQVAINASVGGASGTFNFHVGLATNTIPIDPVTFPAGWNRIVHLIGTLSWLRSINKVPFDVRLQFIRTAGTLLVDDLILTQFDPYDGAWIVAVGGGTAWRLKDKGTFADSEIGSVIQRWLWRAGFGYLPSAPPGTVTVPDP